MVINPYLTNRERLAILGEALHGRHWESATARSLGCQRCTVQDWRGQRAVDAGREPPDAAIGQLIQACKDQIKRLEVAIEETRLPPWIDG